MKEKVIKVSFILFLLICACFATTKTYAATEPSLLPYDLIWNIESYYYYLDSAATKYATPIANAANNWVYTGYGWNNLYPNTKTSNMYDSACDFSVWNIGNGSNASTYFFKRSNGHSGTPSSANPEKENWLYNEVWLNSRYLDSMSNTSKQGVVCHEFGHCFGLYDNNSNKNSIMCQEGSGRAVYKVQQVDQNAFNKKHP